MTLQITSQSIRDELESRAIKTDILHNSSGTIIRFEYEGNVRMTRSSCPDLTSSVAESICADKVTFDKFARTLKLPMLPTEEFSTIEAAEKFVEKYRKVVVKPTLGAHGNGITLAVKNVMELKVAIAQSKKEYPESGVLLQKYVRGDDYRVLVINQTVVAVAKRVPAEIVGDGIHTIEQCIQNENDGAHRSKVYSKTAMHIDEQRAAEYLGKEMNTIPAVGQTRQVIGTANIGTGGHAEEALLYTPEYVKASAIRLAKEAGAFVCGVDYMRDKASKEWFLIEANTSPSFGLHMYPTVGSSTPVDKIFVDNLLKSSIDKISNL